ncbi:MAG: hypothetical protein IJ789_03685 [Bacteroidales bacterium]|nr:hypothetical protein [Bacteroidales bacterium]
MPPTTGGAAWGTAGCNMGGEPFSDAASLAQAVFSPKVMIGLAYVRPFALKELAYKSFTFISPVGEFGVTAAAYSHSGNATFNQQYTSAGYAMHLGRDIALGLTLNYFYTGADDPHYNSLRMLSATISLAARPAEGLTVDFNLFNPYAVSFGAEQRAQSPALATLGASYRVAPQLLARVQIDKELTSKLQVRAGLEYTFLEHFKLRAGVANEPLVYAFGMAVDWDGYGVDLAAQLHPVLGFTPQVASYFSF